MLALPLPYSPQPESSRGLFVHVRLATTIQKCWRLHSLLSTTRKHAQIDCTGTSSYNDIKVPARVNQPVHQRMRQQLFLQFKQFLFGIPVTFWWCKKSHHIRGKVTIHRPKDDSAQNIDHELVFA